MAVVASYRSSHSPEAGNQNQALYKVWHAVCSVGTFYVVLEAIREVAIRTFSKMPELFDEAIESIVLAPAVEEILFRFIMLDGIKVIQHATCSYFRSRPATQEELHAQKVFRVWVTAIAFGLAHLGNYTGFSTAGKVAVISWHILGGLTYGYLKEAADSVAASLMYHSYHNYIVLCSKANILNSNQTVALIIIPRLVLLALLTKGSEIKRAIVTLPHNTIQVAKDINAFVKDAITQVESVLFTKSSLPHPHALEYC